ARTIADLAMVLSVHQSNYEITGFSEQTSIGELATLGVPVVADIGSGLLDAACPWLDGPPPRWLADEPAARQTLDAGADLVLFSGDKLLGGPQAGIIAGRSGLVAACRAHPLARALRPGGLVLEALQDTLLSYLRRDSAAIPFWRMADTSVETLIDRATAIADAVDSVSVRFQLTEAVPGGGTLPGRTIPSAGVRCEGNVAPRLRSRDVPVMARVQEGATVCDLRTVDPDDDAELVAALQEATGPPR
ncbi:MAG: aminotransferase class V-fold PLP-dependent enzyme, partial [Acidimicrobiia bacterium]